VCCYGNRTYTARLLGISLRTLRSKLHYYAQSGCAVCEPNSQLDQFICERAKSPFAPCRRGGTEWLLAARWGRCCRHREKSRQPLRDRVPLTGHVFSASGPKFGAVVALLIFLIGHNFPIAS
jgi:hypothetical protein